MKAKCSSGSGRAAHGADGRDEQKGESTVVVPDGHVARQVQKVSHRLQGRREGGERPRPAHGPGIVHDVGSVPQEPGVLVRRQTQRRLGHIRGERAHLGTRAGRYGDAASIRNSREVDSGRVPGESGGNVLRIPTIHVHGILDPRLTLHRKLFEHFCHPATRRLVEWNGSHRVPLRHNDVLSVVQQIRKYAKETEKKV
ncbi:hypothetical protein MMC15_007932 [Xylographa vitiligo]|nr:hypothetical protein [Xylographa vitiligo]